MDEDFCCGSELLLTRYCFLPFSLISSSFFSMAAFMLLYLLLYVFFFPLDNSLLRLEELCLLNLGSMEEKLVTLSLSGFCS